MPYKFPYRVTSPWGESIECPTLSDALAELNTPVHKNSAVEHWLDGAWVRVEV